MKTIILAGKTVDCVCACCHLSLDCRDLWMGDFPGSPVVRSLRFHCRRRGFPPWAGKLRSHMSKKIFN